MHWQSWVNGPKHLRPILLNSPNISASVPQLKGAIAELQAQGLPVPSYPENPKSDDEKEIKERYGKVLGSAVNPVLREGNSDRKVALPVKEYARQHPHSMGEWEKTSPSHVASMTEGDFYAHEESAFISVAQNLRIELLSQKGELRVLKDKVPVDAGELVDTSRMDIRALRKYLDREMKIAQREGLLVSLHLKATMMKVSDPIIFGEALKVYFSALFEGHGDLLEEMGVDARDGLRELYAKLDGLSPEKKRELEKAIETCFQKGPPLAMVDSHKGISNFHVPSDVIIDASMPAMIRNGGKMWGRDGQLHPTKALIPDRSYAGVYQATIDFCKRHGAFDPRKMGSVSNVGLMAKKAEEYGSHNKTFWIKEAGKVRVLNENNDVLMEHQVEEGDLWRMCQTKEVAIEDWIKLALRRARNSSCPTLFWLDSKRSHDACLIEKVKAHLNREKGQDQDLEIHIMSPQKACTYTLEKIKEGKDCISATGNVLRDYLTDLFPILELGTSAKMLSIVPLLAGGGLFETGAGGSAPRHVEQFLEENHLRWDSLGEFLALGASLEDLGEKSQNQEIAVLAKALESANRDYLNDNRAPSRRVGELDTRGGHFYLAMYWAKALALQSDEPRLSEKFKPLAEKLEQKRDQILEEINSVQGQSISLGGYYYPNENKVAQAMRPSPTLNKFLK